MEKKKRVEVEKKFSVEIVETQSRGEKVEAVIQPVLVDKNEKVVRVLKEGKGERMEITEKDLEKLAALADVELYVILHAPQEGTPEKDVDQYLRAFTAVHYYFAQLTLDALQDRKRAEWLAPILDRLEQRMIVYTGALGSFAQLLQLKHEIKGVLPLPAPPEKILEGIKHLIQVVPYEMVMAGHERVRQKDNQVSKEELLRNVMFL